MTDRSIEEVISDFSGALLAIDGVEGVYEGVLNHGRPCVKVALRQRNDTLEARVSAILEDYPVVFVETGEIVPHDDNN